MNNSCGFVISFFRILTIFNKKPTTFKNISLRFSVNSWKYVHFWILVFMTILILIKFPFQRYISGRHLNFGPTYENGHHGDFPSFWKSLILGLVDHCVVCTKIFLEVIGSYKNLKQEFSLDSKILWVSITGLGVKFQLKMYRGVILHDTEELCKVWRKTNLLF